MFLVCVCVHACNGSLRAKLTRFNWACSGSSHAYASLRGDAATERWRDVGVELKPAVRPVVLAGCTLETHTHTHIHRKQTFKLKYEHVHADAEVNLHNHTKVESVMLPSV